MADGEIPIPAELGGGTTRALPEIDTTVLRDALAVLLLDHAELGKLVAPYVTGEALTQAPLIELQTLGEHLRRCESDLAYAIEQVRSAYATVKASRA